MPPCLTHSFIRYGLWVMGSNPMNGVAPHLHLRGIAIKKFKEGLYNSPESSMIETSQPEIFVSLSLPS